ncbi:MAG TPA: cytochrome c1 [Beijerinckiaceae bacterium]|nr:cytochrome c1 [Beijerinckiaceae bacterium]
MFRSLTPRRIAAAVLASGLIAGAASIAHAAGGDTPKPEKQSWSFSGPFGTFDRAQLQRGFKVYKEVCANCHSLNLVAFRNLSDKGGPEFSVDQVKALAATYQIKDGPNDKGEMFERPGRPADKFPSPFPNPEAAKASLGGAPPDLSLIAKARSYERGVVLSLVDLVTQYQEHGPDYLVALLAGYSDPPAGVTVGSGLAYNKYFPGGQLSMAQPLNPDQVEYTDGTKGTVEQYAKDVTAFLMWAAEPKMEDRKRIGAFFMMLMITLAFFTYFTKKKVWSRVQH